MGVTDCIHFDFVSDDMDIVTISNRKKEMCSNGREGLRWSLHATWVLEAPDMRPNRWVDVPKAKMVRLE